MADYTKDNEEDRAIEKKLFDRELELLKKMSPTQLKAQAQMELGVTEQQEPNKPMEYYPNQSYVDKKLKGEKIPMGSLQALASAQRRAEKSGVLSPDVAKYMLANALVEGRPDDFGVTQNIFHGGNPKVRDVIKRLGLEGDTKAPVLTPEIESYMKEMGIPKNWKDTDVVINPSDDPKKNARYATAVLAIKAAQAKNAEDAIKLWNGRGPATDLHLAKVKEAHRMLQDPKNAAVLRAYQRALQYSKDED